MKRRVLLFSALVAALNGCAADSADAPPTVQYGDSVCDACGMIISDERFATATIIEGPRGSEARLFDDFNCQANFEIDHPDIAVITRWSHDYTTGQWLRTADAVFLESLQLFTPMASHVAAFAHEEAARAAQHELGGDITTYESFHRRAMDARTTGKGPQ